MPADLPWADELLRAAGALLCHQKASRSLTLGDHTLPICIRCTGLYLGTLGASLALLAARLRPPARRRYTWIVAALLILPTLVDVVAGHYFELGVGPVLRAGLATLAGGGQAWALLGLIDWRLGGSDAGGRPARSVGLVVGGAVAALVLVLAAVGLANISPWPGAPLARWTVGTLSLVGFGAFLGLACAAGSGFLLPAALRRKGWPWGLLGGVAFALVIWALAELPSHMRSPFYWIERAQQWLFG